MVTDLYNWTGQKLLERSRQARCTEQQHNAANDQHVWAQRQSQNSKNGYACDSWVGRYVCSTKMNMLSSAMSYCCCSAATCLGHAELEANMV